MAKNATYKLVYRPEGVSELYDLAADKREMNNVYGQEKYENVSVAIYTHLLVEI